MKRTVEGLIDAWKTVHPECIPKRKRLPRGTRGDGLRYERSAARAAPWMHHGQWFRYLDASGTHYCQTDLLFLARGAVFVVECKLSETHAGREQLQGLYLPVVAAALRRPAYGIVLAQSVRRELLPDNIVATVKDAVELALTGAIPTLHWLGRGALPK